MPRLAIDQLWWRLIRCVGGLALFGTGIALLVRAELGVPPWDVFHQGVANRTGLGLGTVIVITGLLLLVLWIPLRERPGIGTLLNAIEIGVVVELVLPRLPTMDQFGLRVAAMSTGIVLIAIGSGYYIGSGLGPGPRDGLMTGLARRGLSIRAARTGIEVLAVSVGLLLGGTAGIGTVAFALGIGPLVQVFLPRLTVPSDTESTSGSAGAHAQ